MLLETLLGSGLGALAGMIEKPVAQYMDLKAKKAEYAHVEKLQDLNHKQDLLLADKELLGEGIKADAAILQASYQHDSATGETSKWVNNIVKLTRPLCIPLTAFMTYHDPELSVYLGLVLGWWFASRVRSAYPE